MFGIASVSDTQSGIKSIWALSIRVVELYTTLMFLDVTGFFTGTKLMLYKGLIKLNLEFSFYSIFSFS